VLADEQPSLLPGLPQGDFLSRKPRADVAGRPVTFRATAAECEQWEVIAKIEGCASLSAWIVKTLLSRADRVSRKTLLSRADRVSRKTQRTNK
jgi:hypothetical protein